MEDNSIIIIGAGFAGLSAGIYAQMNGYRTQIFEMHNLPGGLCTAWKRKGYTIDGCVHWLTGSSPRSSTYQYWEEVGVAQDREFIYLDEFVRFEGTGGRSFSLYTDVDRLEEHMLELSPRDAEATRDLVAAIRMFLAFDQPSETDPPLRRIQKMVKLGWLMATKGRMMQRWMKMSGADLAERFQDPLIRDAFGKTWVPGFSAFLIVAGLASMGNRESGYPVGGSLPMSQAIARRYLDLGGQIHYRSRVARILTAPSPEGAGDRAVGVRLEDGSEHRAGRVISAADGHTTLLEMLDPKYLDEQARKPYEDWPIVPPLLYVGVGVNRSFADEPPTISGVSFPLRSPTDFGDKVRDRVFIHLYNQDPTLAPEGKTTLIVQDYSDYAYWKELAEDRAAYDEKKDQVARIVVELLEQRFPGISDQIEMVDVATPLTFERYTGNWQGGYMGWMLTPERAPSMMKPTRQTLPALGGFYMCGQWFEPGGGLPVGVMAARRLLQAICKEDRRKFQTTVPD